MKYLLILVLALYVSCTHSMMVNDLGDFNKIWKGTAKIAKIDSSGTGLKQSLYHRI